MRVFVSLALGLLFGFGLVVGGMTDPAKVLNFLDVAAIPAGLWDPSLAFVMGGAVAVAFVGFPVATHGAAPRLGGGFHLPPTMPIEPRLIVGPAIFGIGWGLVGFCPGPALASLGAGTTSAVWFVPAMLAGMALARLVEARVAMASRSSGFERPARAVDNG